jgi:hypothetical protein
MNERWELIFSEYPGAASPALTAAMEELVDG